MPSELQDQLWFSGRDCADVASLTWGSVVLISLIGMWLREHKNTANIAITSFFSSVLFFVITNFGVWLISGMYPITLAGLKDCFVLAMPFFRTELIATAVYSVIFFGAYEFIAKYIRQTRFAHVL